MGSSVARGAGANTFHGYWYQYAQLLADRTTAGSSINSWNCLNISVGGDTTAKVLNRWETDLVPLKSNYVIYGLSLGNEGIHESANQQAIFEGFRDNLLTLIDKAVSSGITPLVMNNYTRADFNKSDYAYIKAINLLIQQWPVPSVNLLGAVDDGSGKWATGFQHDVYHPNDAGHYEMSLAIVPSLFDALKAGKAQPVRTSGTYMQFDVQKESRFLTVDPENSMHSFTLSFDVRTSVGGIVARIKETGGTGIILIDSGSGALRYISSDGGIITGCRRIRDGAWHRVSLTHYYARGKTYLYADANDEGSVTEKKVPLRFALAGTGAPSPISYRDLFMYRSGMNADEIAALVAGKMLKSSLELYCPLDGKSILGTDPLVNLAQSTNTLRRRESF